MNDKTYVKTCKSNDQTNNDKYRVAANITEYHYIKTNLQNYGVLHFTLVYQELSYRVLNRYYNSNMLK